MVQLTLEMGKKKRKVASEDVSETETVESKKNLKKSKKAKPSFEAEPVVPYDDDADRDTTRDVKPKSTKSKKVEATNDRVIKNKEKLAKMNVRARKLYPAFMSYLQSYHKFAEDLPRHFFQVDEEKLAELQEERGEEEEDAEDSEQKSEADAEDSDAEIVPNKGRGPQFGNATRAKTISELKERLKKMKNKSLTYQERLKKKGLKTRLTKKQKLQERAKLKKEKRKGQRSKGNPMKPIVNDDDQKPLDNKKPTQEPKILFSKLEVSQEEGHKKRENKDPKRLLQKIQKSESKLKELEEKGKTETVKKIKEKLSWDKAIQKAEGAKVKDDVELLKKTIKRKEGLKAYSKKKWDKRLEAIEKRKVDTQKKRTENIMKKKKDKKQKKIKKSIKKGRVKI